jgi:anti-sigma factor RsiW
MTTDAQAHPYSMDEVVAYHDGELPQAERAAFEGHLAGCAECKGRLEAATVSLGTLDDFLAEGPPPVDMPEALAALRRGEAEARADRKRRRMVLVAGGIGLAAAAALIAALLIERQAPLPPEPRQQIAPRDQKPPHERQSAPIAPETK